MSQLYCKQKIPLLMLSAIILLIQFQANISIFTLDIRLSAADPLLAIALMLSFFTLKDEGKKDLQRIAKLMQPLSVLFLWMILSSIIVFVESDTLGYWGLKKVAGIFIIGCYFFTSYVLCRTLDLRCDQKLFSLFVSLSFYVVILSLIYHLTIHIDGSFNVLEYTNYDRLYGFMGNPNAFSFFLIIVMFLHISFLASSNKDLTLKDIIYIFLFSGAIFLTGSRGGFLALFLTVILVSPYSFRRFGVLLLLIIIGFMSPLVIEYFITYVGAIGNWLLQFTSNDKAELPYRVANIASYYLSQDVLTSGADNGFNERWDSYKYSIQLWLDSPVIGSGLGRFIENTKSYGFREGLVIHNTFLWVLSELGLVGAIILSWMFLFFFGRFWELRIHATGLCGIMILIAAFIMSQTTEILFQRHLWVVFGILFAYMSDRIRSS